VSTKFITIDSSDFDRLTNALDQGEIITPEFVRDTLEETSQELIRSIQAGFIRQADPDGRKWPKNPEWWQLVKGHKKANIGIQPTSSQTGPFIYEKSKKHMKDSIKYSIKDGNAGGLSMESTIEYEEEARERAKHTQEGGRVEFKKKSRASGQVFTYIVNVIARPHMALANWSRHPFAGTGDVKMVEAIWLEAITNQIENFIARI
jgi:hypothetical protein